LPYRRVSIRTFRGAASLESSSQTQISLGRPQTSQTPAAVYAASAGIAAFCLSTL
jgi:hypothetical protein